MSRGWKPPADPAKDAMDSLKDLIFGTGANTRSDKHLAAAACIMFNAIRLLQAIGATPEEIGEAISNRGR